MKKIITILALIFIAGCSTSYKSDGFNGGYSETQLDENIFQVRFRGNSITSLERAADFNMLRSAELTLESGYKYFTVANQNNYIEEIVTIKPARIEKTTTSEDKGKIDRDKYHDTAYKTKSTEKEVITFVKEEKVVTKIPHAYQEITCYKEKPKNAKSYSAEFLVKSLKTKYEIDD